VNVKLRYKLLAFMSVLAAVFLWGRCGRSASQNPPQPSVLPKDTVVRVTTDPSKNHVRIEQQGQKTLDMFLPDRPSTFEVKTDGTVRVSSAQYGFERKLFFGVFASEHLRIGAGIDLMYWKKLDLGIGLASQIGNYPPVVFAQVSYVVYDNLRLGLTVDNRQRIGGSLSVRI